MLRTSSHTSAAWMGMLLGLLLPWTAALAQPSGQTPKALDGVGVQERLGETIPDHLVFYDEQGQPVEIGAFFRGETPVMLNLVYHDCPMLCNLLLDGLTKALKQMAWTPGQEFEVVTVSFSAEETPQLAARQKALYLERLGRPEAASGWHFLTGEEASIQALAAAVGFQFRWDETQQQYAHPAVLLFLSGDRKLTRYLYGLEYAPRDVRTALVEASEGKVGSPLDQVLLFCFQYDPEANSYVPYATNIMKLGGLLTMLVLGMVLFIFWRREKTSLDEAVAAS